MLNSPYKLPPILPPADHPRLMLRKEDIKRIRTASAGSVAEKLFLELCELSIEGIGADASRGTYHLKEYLALEAKALRSLLEGDRARGREVVDILLGLMRSIYVYDAHMQARFSGHFIFLAAEVYDWCYPLITCEERLEIIGVCESLAEKHFEMGYPPARQAAISGHGSEAQLLRDLLAFSIAVYDERPDIYNYCAGRLFEEYLPVYQTFFMGEFHPQGPCYGAYRYSWTMWFGLLIYSMSKERVLTPGTVSMADSLLYLRRSDGEAMRLGDDYNETKALYTHKNPFFVPMFLAAAYSGDAIWYAEAQDQMREEYLLPLHWGYDFYDEGAYGEGVISPSVYMIWNRLTPPTEARKLKNSRHFGWPIGVSVYNDGQRTVLMKLGCLWGSNHDHLDTGCFQIYDGEILASDSGVYDSYGTPHRKKYAIQTLAHNCITVDGKGTRTPCGRREPETLEDWLRDYRMARIISHTEADDGCTLEGDLSDAYADTCSFVTRKMVWEASRGERGTLTVYDEIAPKKEDAEVKFLIHCQSRPIVRENEIIIEGKSRELHCRILSPDKTEIAVIGGEGRRFWANGEEYLPEVDTSEAGWGRVEICSVGSTVFNIEMEICRKDKGE